MNRVSVGLILMIAILGCGGARVEHKLPFDMNPRRSSESKIWITRPTNTDVVRIGEPIQCTGRFRIGPGHRPMSQPKVAILLGRASMGQFRAEQDPQQPDGDIPFHVELKGMDRPGKYTLRATLSLGIGKGGDAGPPPQMVLASAPTTITIQDTGE